MRYFGNKTWPVYKIDFISDVHTLCDCFYAYLQCVDIQ